MQDETQRRKEMLIVGPKLQDLINVTIERNVNIARHSKNRSKYKICGARNQRETYANAEITRKCIDTMPSYSKSKYAT